MKKDKSVIALMGDLSLNDLFIEDRERNRKRFEQMAPLLEKYPLVLANLEAPVMGNGEYNREKENGRGVLHNTEESVLQEVLPMLNIGALSLANNHIYDCGKSGMINTISCLEKLGILYTGAGTIEKHLEPVFFDIAKKRIAFAAYVDKDTNPLIPEDAEIFINYFDEAVVTAKIIDIKKNCDMLILSIHWGQDYSAYPNSSQIETAHRLNKAGADIIMGHHSHMLQVYETVEMGSIFYGLGSFCYGDFIYEGKRRALKRKTKISMVAIINTEAEIDDILPIRELSGNIVIPIKRIKNNRIKLFIMYLSQRYSVFRWMLRIKETVFDRIWEYFFGYYRNPLTQLFSFSNLKKFTYIKRDLKKK